LTASSASSALIHDPGVVTTRPEKFVFVIVVAQIDDTARGCFMLIGVSVRVIDDAKLKAAIVYRDDDKLVVEVVAGIVIVIAREHHVGCRKDIVVLQFVLLEASDLGVPVVCDM
jgi:hypothetical protein